jgi:RNA polymerase sigma-70 factor (ECF subfamily)
MSTSHAHAFQPSRWTLVARATQDDAPAARAALDELGRIYWPPLCCFATRWGLSEADAEDATQNYFAELLRNDKFAIADAERGRLRTHPISSWWRRMQRGTVA